MEPYIELALERWAREYNNKYDRELSDYNKTRMRYTHPHLFGESKSKQKEFARKKLDLMQRGNTEDVLRVRAAKKDIQLRARGSALERITEVLNNPVGKVDLRKPRNAIWLDSWAHVSRGRDSSRTLTVPAEIYNTPVEKLGLSSRALNCVKRARINLIGEVLERNQSDLRKIRNFGQKSLDELLQAVTDFIHQFRTEGS